MSHSKNAMTSNSQLSLLTGLRDPHDARGHQNTPDTERLPVIRKAADNFPALPSKLSGTLPRQQRSVSAGPSGPGQARRAGAAPPPQSPSSWAQGGPGQERKRGAEARGYLRPEGSCGGLGGRLGGRGRVAALGCPCAGPLRRQPRCGGR